MQRLFLEESYFKVKEVRIGEPAETLIQRASTVEILADSIFGTTPDIERGFPLTKRQREPSFCAIINQYQRFQTSKHIH